MKTARLTALTMLLALPEVASAEEGARPRARPAAPATATAAAAAATAPRPTPVVTLKAPARAATVEGPISWIRRPPPPPPPPPVRVRLGASRWVGWGHGEQLTYAISLAGVEGGRAALSVGRLQRKGSARVLRLRGLGETVPFISTFSKMSEEVLTQIDLEGLMPLTSVADRKTNSKEDRWIETTYRSGAPEVGQHIRQHGRSLRRTRRIARPLYDPISALYALRSQAWPAGKRRAILVLAGNSLYDVELSAGGRERIYTRLGPRDTFRVDGIGRRILDNGQEITSKKPRKVSIWFSADKLRLPVKLTGETTLGLLEAAITSFSPARRRTRVRIARLPAVTPRGPTPPPPARRQPTPPTGARTRPVKSTSAPANQGRAVFGARR